MGKLETSRKGIEGLREEHDEGLLDDTVQEQEEELTFDKIMQRLSKSKEETLEDDAARLRKEAKEQEELTRSQEETGKEIQSIRDSIEGIFG